MSEWISVTDEVPEHDDLVYIWPPVELGDWHHTASYNCYTGIDWDITFDIGNGFSSVHHPNPTHWKTIEPPKETS